MSTRPTTSRNKQPYVIAEVTRMANKRGPGVKLPTAQQLAKQLGVTLTTLDRSLAKLESKGIIQRRQGSGIYASNHLLNKHIGLVFGRNIFQMGSSAFYLLLLQHCEKKAAMEQDQFSFYLAPPNKESHRGGSAFNQDLADSLKQGKLDGLVLCEIDASEQEEWLKSQNIPAVALAPSKLFSSVGINTKKLIDSCVETLAKQGCQSVGLLGILSRHVKLFEDAVAKYKMKIRQECVIHPDDESDPPFDTHETLGREWMQRCLDRCGGADHLPDGIVITDDILARGAALKIKELGIRPGIDVKIASHANKGSLVLEYWQDSMILAEVDPKRVVETMFKMLDTLMSGDKLKRKRVTLTPQIRVPPSK